MRSTPPAAVTSLGRGRRHSLPARRARARAALREARIVPERGLRAALTTAPELSPMVRTSARAAAKAAALVLTTTLLAPRTAQAQQGEIYGSEDLTSAPKLASPAAAARLIARSIPEDVRRGGGGGTVQLQFVIGRDGRVEPGSVEVVSSPAPSLASAAKAVAEKMEFVPGKKDGAAVRSRVQLPIVYKQ